MGTFPACWRRSLLTRCRFGNVPDLEVDDGPDEDALAGGKPELRAVDDGRVFNAVSWDGHWVFFLVFFLDGRDFGFASLFGAPGSSSFSMRMALPKYTLLRSS